MVVKYNRYFILKKTKEVYSVKHNLLNKAYLYRVSLFLAHILPLSLMRWFSKNVAFVSYYFYKNARKNVENNLSHIFGDAVKIRNVAKEVFINYGLYLADWAKLISVDASNVFSFFGKIEGIDIFKTEHEKGNGVIILSAHLGNWELGGLAFTHSGIPFNIITAKDEDESIAQVRSQVRALHNIKTITIGEDPFFFVDIINALRRNEIVAMLVDRYEKRNGVLIEFLGGKAYFPQGPVLLARSTGASVMPSFTVLEKDRKYRSVLGAPIQMEWSDDKEQDIHVNVAKIACVFEQYIRLYPNQWFNFSSIWK